ncbi:MAG: cell wall hydrolase [Hungatella sp.]|nr:cell wall hydrolase [Hungatella sp.]
MTEVEKILYRKANYGPHMLLVKKEAETEPEPEPLSYTEEDLYVLAHAICGEGQGYPDEEQLYIGSVILNRRAHGAYPDTIRGVVFQKGQYACTWDGNYYREPTAANWNNARWLLENGSVLPGNVVYQAGFRQGSGLYVQTRYHKYCYR